MFSLVAVIAILASGSGVAYASESSLPGDGLYPVKRAVESLRLAVSLTPEGDAGLLLEMAETRLSEVSRLSDLDREDDLPAALAGYDQAVGQLLGLARGWPSEADQADLDKLQTRLARHAQVLSALQSKAPQTAQDGLRNALQRSTERQKEVKELMELRGKKPGSLPRGSPSITPSPVDDVKDRGEGKGPKEDRGPSSKAPPGQMTKTPKPES
jgi:hypothetical protein